MLVSEMIRRLRVALSDEEAPYKYSTNRIFLWLQGAYMDRQLASSFWSFLHKRELFITTVAGTADYTAPLIKDIDYKSIYYTEVGSATHIPLSVMGYSEWVTEQANGVVYAPSTPLYIIETPEFKWKIYPTPSKVYEIYTDQWLKPTEFVDLNDAPVWEDQYHEIVVLDAMKIAAALQPDSPESNVMLAQVRTRLPRLERLFNARYLPPVGKAGAHL